MFFSGFFVARQLRPLQNVPSISMMFVQYRWLISIIMGIFIGGVFSLGLFFETKFLAWNVFAFIAIFFMVSIFHYVGLFLGWGDSLSTSENIIPPNQPLINRYPEHVNVIVDDKLDSVKIIINSQKRWGWFVMSLFNLVVMGFCALPFLSLILITVLRNYLPENIDFLAWPFVGAVVLYLIYTKFFQEALEYVFDKEIIEVDNFFVKIEKYGLGFKSRKKYSVDNIKKITTMFPLVGITKRSPFVNSNMPAFMIWHKCGLKRCRSFGRAVDLADAQSILDTIYSKFPQYKD